uniref:Uncharacterized protein n=1 Tax=Avena sativa TaxID=4498 RepID=A0ACD5TXX5_AVESA
MSLLLALGQQLLLLLLALPCLSCASNSTQARLDRQAKALLQWKSGLFRRGTYDLDSWTQETSPCDWFGVHCSTVVPSHGRDQGDVVFVVSEISLLGCGLNGRLDRLHFADLPHLEYLDLSYNSLSGPIPSSIGALAKIKYLDLSWNFLDDSIPPFIGLPHLSHLNLRHNSLSGRIPSNVGALAKLKYLDLSYNLLDGYLPSALGTLRKLTDLSLSNNNLTGPIIPSLVNLTNLRSLDISNNHIKGSIPRSIGNLTILKYLDLSNNQINGIIPPELGSLVLLSHLDLSSNQFFGSIPPQIVHCHLLSSLCLSDNLLNGLIPQELGYLTGLIELDLSRNNLSGAIPVSLSMLCHLFDLNLAYNSLSGRATLPSSASIFTTISLDHNMALCGDSQYNLPPCESPKLDSEQESIKRPNLLFLVAFVGPLSLVCLVIASITVVCWRRKLVKSSSKTKSGDILSIWNFDGNIAFEDILNATENFDEKYCIGVGGYGSVFRVVLEGGIIFAIKLLHSMEEYSDEGTFHAEIEVLTKIRHRCIVKLYGFCSHSQIKFLIYDLIEGGSLSSILHEQELAKELDWPTRIAVVTDVAQALSYLHHDCEDPFVHRDIKSSNILLDLDYKAYVSDFGMARKLKHGYSSWSTIFAGTCGYIAPGTYISLNPFW